MGNNRRPCVQTLGRAHIGKCHMGGSEIQVCQEKMEPENHIGRGCPTDHNLDRTAHVHGRTTTLECVPTLGLAYFILSFVLFYLDLCYLLKLRSTIDLFPTARIKDELFLFLYKQLQSSFEPQFMMNNIWSFLKFFPLEKGCLVQSQGVISLI